MTTTPVLHVVAGGVTVHATGTLATLAHAALEQLRDDQVASKLMKQDYTLWGPEAEAESKIRLGWINAPQTSRALLPQIGQLVQRSRNLGLDHVVLAGMGGSSLAPEVIAGSAGVELTTLDTTDPQQVRAALGQRLERTVLVVSSKSGSTIETDSHRRVYEAAFAAAGLDNMAQRIIVVTDPGSPLEASARQAGYTVVLADPMVGGRYSALTAFGLVPSALAGVNVEQLLADAEAALAALQADENNPGLALGALLGAAGKAGRDKVLIADAGSGMVGFGDWVEQLVAESTGKEGKGLLPVVVPTPQAADFAHPGAHDHRVYLRPSGFQATQLPDEDGDAGATHISGPLGAAFVTWEYATAVASRIIEVSPFDQPNVQAAKSAALALLEPSPAPSTVNAPSVPVVEVGANDAEQVRDIVRQAVAHVGAEGYLGVLAYLDRHAQASLASIREDLAEALVQAGTNAPVTFGWGPRYLHSTGQYHKGGPSNGVFLVITGESNQPEPVPGRDYTFAQLQRAQADGDAAALAASGCTVTRLHLTHRTAGVEMLLSAAQALGTAR